MVTCGESYYIGSTGNLATRESAHRWHLKRGTHANRNLQAGFTESGGVASFAVLVYASGLDNLKREEQIHLDSCFGLPGCCNLSPHASGASDDTRRKMAGSKKGVKNHNSRALILTRDGVDTQFECLSDAARHLGVSQQTMHLWCKGEVAWPGTGGRGCRKMHKHVADYTFRWTDEGGEMAPHNVES